MTHAIGPIVEPGGGGMYFDQKFDIVAGDLRERLRGDRLHRRHRMVVILGHDRQCGRPAIRLRIRAGGRLDPMPKSIRDRLWWRGLTEDCSLIAL